MFLANTEESNNNNIKKGSLHSVREVNSKDNKLFKMKTKSQTKLSVPDRTCMFSLQEYQHVHLLWLRSGSFTLVWKPNPPLCSVCCAHPSRSCWRVHSAYTLLLLCSRARCVTQSATTSNFLTQQLSKKWSQSRALNYIKYIFIK